LRFQKLLVVIKQTAFEEYSQVSRSRMTEVELSRIYALHCAIVQLKIISALTCQCRHCFCCGYSSDSGGRPPRP